MTSDDNKRQEYFRRIRRLKRILRPLPRRGNLHRYPVLKWFARAARRRSYLWAFRKQNVIPAIYVGCILAFLPPPTPQFPMALLFGLLLRCNLMVGTALTFITNPFTVVPIYYMDYRVGGFILKAFGTPDLAEEITPEIAELYDAQDVLPIEVKLGIMQRIFDGWIQTAVGGLAIGLTLAALLHLLYLLLAKRYGKHEHTRSYPLLGLGRTRSAEAPGAQHPEAKEPSAQAPDTQSLDTQSANAQPPATQAGATEPHTGSAQADGQHPQG